jgi:predicted Zn-dependent protease
MGHADHRHSTTQMTKEYGIQTLLDVVLGNNQNQLTQIASSLVNLTFSRADETDADKQSVTYLCPTKYRANGAQDFFVKIANSGGSTNTSFFEHPSKSRQSCSQYQYQKHRAWAATVRLLLKLKLRITRHSKTALP